MLPTLDINRPFIHSFPELLDVFPRTIILLELPKSIKFNADYSFKPRTTYTKLRYKHSPNVEEDKVTEESCFRIVLQCSLLNENITLKFDEAEIRGLFSIYTGIRILSELSPKGGEKYTEYAVGKLFTSDETKKMLDTLLSTKQLDNFSDALYRQLRILYEFNRLESVLIDFVRS